MKLFHVIQSVYCEPWLIMPQMHEHICSIIDAHVSGDAHKPGGIIEQFRAAEHPDTDDDDKDKMEMQDGIAVLPVRGVITNRASLFAEMSGIKSIPKLTEMLQAFRHNDEVRGILLDVDSPGGSVVGVPEFADLIREVSEEKPIVAFTDGLMASAAYWLASGAGAIISTGSAVIGSIGVILPILDQSHNFRMRGLKPDVIKHGKFKDMGLAGTALTTDQRKHLQDNVNAIFSDFKAFITAERDIPDSAMEGQTFRGKDSLGVGLIDAVGSRDDAMQELRDMIAFKHTDRTTRTGKDRNVMASWEVDRTDWEEAIANAPIHTRLDFTGKGETKQNEDYDRRYWYKTDPE